MRLRLTLRALVRSQRVGWTQRLMRSRTQNQTRLMLRWVRTLPRVRWSSRQGTYRQVSRSSYEHHYLTNYHIKLA